MSTSLFLTLRYRDASAALDYLVAGLGLVERSSYRNPDDESVVEHAELGWGDTGGVMLGTSADEARVGRGAAYLVVTDDADVDRVHAQALAHGFTELRVPEDMDYGGRGSTVVDPEGNEWSLGSYQGA